MGKYRISDTSIRKPKTTFNPTREFLQKSIDDYIKNGGRIKQLPAQSFKKKKKSVPLKTNPYGKSKMIEQYQADSVL